MLFPLKAISLVIEKRTSLSLMQGSIVVLCKTHSRYRKARNLPGHSITNCFHKPMVFARISLLVNKTLTFPLLSTVFLKFISLVLHNNIVNMNRIWSAHRATNPGGITTTRPRTFRLRHFVYRHFVYRYFVYYDFPCWNRSWSDETNTISPI